MTVLSMVASENEVDKLARYLFRCLHHSDSKMRAIHLSIAESILKTAAEIPSDCYLLLGGSFSRGEPCIRISEDEYMVLSDFDFFVVSNTNEPPITELQFLNIASRYLSGRISVCFLTTEQYQRIGTSIGRDIKVDSICLNHEEPPPYEAVTITARDSFEICLYAITQYFEKGISRRYLAGDSSDGFHYLLHRITSNSLFSAAMLYGSYSLHDTADLPPSIQQSLLHELRWRDDPDTSVRPELGTCLRAIKESLRIHRTYGYYKLFGNAVNGSEFAVSEHGRYVAYIQDVVLELMNAILKGIDHVGLGSVSRLAHAIEHYEWKENLLHYDEITKAYDSVENWLGSEGDDFRHHLFQMKLEEIPDSQAIRSETSIHSDLVSVGG